MIDQLIPFRSTPLCRTFFRVHSVITFLCPIWSFPLLHTSLFSSPFSSLLLSFTRRALAVPQILLRIAVMQGHAERQTVAEGHFKEAVSLLKDLEGAGSIAVAGALVYVCVCVCASLSLFRSFAHTFAYLI